MCFTVRYTRGKYLYTRINLEKIVSYLILYLQVINYCVISAHYYSQTSAENSYIPPTKKKIIGILLIGSTFKKNSKPTVLNYGVSKTRGFKWLYILSFTEHWRRKKKAIIAHEKHSKSSS